jgi:hypothetical protein
MLRNCLTNVTKYIVVLLYLGRQKGAYGCKPIQLLTEFIYETY